MHCFPAICHPHHLLWGSEDSTVVMKEKEREKAQSLDRSTLRTRSA